MKPTLHDTTGEIIDAAVQIHIALGPGLLESFYERLLANELARRGLRVERQVTRPVTFAGMTFDHGVRVDLIVEDRVIVEIKSREHLNPIHARQLLTYLRVLNLPVGLLINFGCETLRQGLRRMVNNYERES